MWLRGAVVQSLNERHRRLRCMARPDRTSPGSSGYASTMRPRPTRSTHPLRTTDCATLGRGYDISGVSRPTALPARFLTIRFSLEQRSDQEVVLVYSDNGRGMTDAVKAQAFDPFFSTRIGKGGSGLGLHLVLSLMEGRLGGHLVLETALGQGVTFHLTLPVKAPQIVDANER